MKKIILTGCLSFILNQSSCMEKDHSQKKLSYLAVVSKNYSQKKRDEFLAIPQAPIDNNCTDYLNKDDETVMPKQEKCPLNIAHSAAPQKKEPEKLSYLKALGNKKFTQKKERSMPLLEKEEQGSPEFFAAIRRNNIFLVDTYLASDPSIVNKRSAKGELPLSLAISHNHLDLALHLLKNKADVNELDADKPPIIWAFFVKLSYQIKEDDVFALLGLLKEFGADLKACENHEKSTALHFAAARGYTEIIKFLLKHGIPVDIRDQKGKTPLHLAAYNGKTEAVKILLENKADINTETTENFSPLHYAALSGSVNCLDLLIRKGADINAHAKKRSVTPFLIAVTEGHLDAVKFLIEKKADINIPDKDLLTPLHKAIQNDSTLIVSLLLKHKAAVNTANSKKTTPLHHAASIGNPEIVQMLLDDELINIDAQNEDHFTPLHFAALKGNTRTIELLLEHNANHDAKTSNGYTAVHFLAKYGFQPALEVLLAARASVNVQGKNKITPLHCAAMSQNIHMIDFLLKHNADPYAATNDGRTYRDMLKNF